LGPFSVLLVSGFGGGLGASVQKVVRACRCVALVGMAAVFAFALALGGLQGTK
jgi:hypothetical protein